jgi:MoaA/NifB/PqqE/SkfB family radical SAM enzyme
MIKIKTLRGTPKHLTDKRELASFTYLMLNLPFNCNYHCLKCFNIADDDRYFTGKQKYIPLDDRIKIIHEAKDMGGKAVVIAGEGEPALHKDTEKIISETDRLGMIPIIYTNGSTLTEDLIEFYKNTNTSVVISLDSLDPKTYDYFTGTKKQFEKVIKNIENLRKTYRNTIEISGDLKTVRVALNATVTDINENEIQKIKEFCRDDIYFICNPLARYGNAISNWDELIRSEESQNRHAQLIRELSESGGPLTLDRKGFCGYSRWGIGVNPLGDYMTCAYTKKTDGLLGSIKNISLKEAFKHKHIIESAHYGLYGHMPCLIRDASFEDYLKKLKEKI